MTYRIRELRRHKRIHTDWHRHARARAHMHSETQNTHSLHEIQKLYWFHTISCPFQQMIYRIRELGSALVLSGLTSISRVCIDARDALHILGQMLPNSQFRQTNCPFHEFAKVPADFTELDISRSDTISVPDLTYYLTWTQTKWTHSVYFYDFTETPMANLIMLYNRTPLSQERPGT